MRHVLSAVVQNVPGVLAHVSGMLASRGFNIDSLAVGETEDPGLSRMTFVVHGDDHVLEQARKQLDNISLDTMMIEVAGQESKVEAFVELMRPYGILELARTGRIALIRGVPKQ